ncbi:MAG: TonB family protein, partial [Proteobacteria bacterium]|nr:TonB family protein [Pseudomonadota bacterium]
MERELHRTNRLARATAPTDRDVTVIDDVVRRLRERDRAAAGSGDSSAWNVVAFSRAPRTTLANAPLPAPMADLTASVRAVPDAIAEGARRRFPALVAISVAIHGSIFAVADFAPKPLASLGEQAIAVEIVLGSTVAAGLATAPSEFESADKAAAAANAQKSATSDKPPDAQVVEDRSQLRDQLEPLAQAEPEPGPRHVPPPQQSIAEVAADKVESKPENRPAGEPEATKPAAPKPAARREKDQRRSVATRQTRAPAATSAASSGVGRGRSEADENYRGRVVAHLARNKRYPADARQRREQGSVLISFAIDAGGRVTLVKINRGSGFAALDREAEQMVRRASPFPSPPRGQP